MLSEEDVKLIHEAAILYKDVLRRGTLSLSDLKQIFDEMMDSGKLEWENKMRHSFIEIFATHGIDCSIFLKDYKK
jgi:hypothetical protein